MRMLVSHVSAAGITDPTKKSAMFFKLHQLQAIRVKIYYGN